MNYKIVEYMERRVFRSMRASIAGICLFVALIASTSGAFSIGTDEPAQMESRIADKVAAYVAEENFWGLKPIKVQQLKLILFSAEKGPVSDFDVLAIVPEINETLKFRSCSEGMPMFTSGRGKSNDAKIDADKYLSNEMERFSGFIAHAKRSEQFIQVVSDPNALFDSEPAFRARRIAQIKSALGTLVHQRPLEIRVAYFSKLTDQIDVLVPSRAAMYTMSVVHRSCDSESVEVGRYFPLKSVRADLRQKIEQYSSAEIVR